MAQLSAAPADDTDTPSHIDLRETIPPAPEGAGAPIPTDGVAIAPVDRPTPRQLGIAVLTTVTLLFGLLLALGSEQPVTSGHGPMAVADGEPSGASAQPLAP